MKKAQRLIVTFLFLIIGSLAAASDNPPNIIVVMSDDQGQWALGAYGMAQIQTPNLDWLAKEGVMFQNAYSPAPVCSPARASFHTGKMPSQHGIHDFLGSGPEFDAGWLAGETLLSERMQKAGYRTALIGKWHLTSASMKPGRGFDRWLSYDESVEGWPNQYVHQGTVYFSDDGKPKTYTGVQARFLTEEAVRFIDDPADEPFFISLNFVEPHAPFEGLPERLVSRHRALAKELIRIGGASDLPDRGAFNLTPEDHYERLAQYLAAISLVDEQVGRLVDALESRDLLNNTLLVFVSDHGLLMGQYGLYGKTNASNPQNFYEETIRIPMIMYGPPALLQRQQTRGEFVDLIDLHATIVDIATGGQTLASEYGPGQSFRQLLLGSRSMDWRKYQYAERGNARMISDGHWKLVRYYGESEGQAPVNKWYDLSHPLRERFATVAPRLELKNKLIQELESYFAKHETPLHTGREIWKQPYPNQRVRDEQIKKGSE